MTDFSFLRSVVSQLSLSDATVDTDVTTLSLAALKQATLDVQSSDPAVAEWLSDEHYAGAVLVAAATMNKRAEASGKGNPFNRQSRDQIVDQFNRWAAQFVERIDAVADGRAAAAQFLPRLAAFKADPINNRP